MKRRPLLNDPNINPPAYFFNRIIRDLSSESRSHLLRSIHDFVEPVPDDPNAEKAGISDSLPSPDELTRLGARIRSDEAFLQDALGLWGRENLAVTAYIEMLDRDFIYVNLTVLKDLLGPDRLFAGLFLLGHLEDEEIRNQIDDRFWERKVLPETVEPLIPALEISNDLIREYPQAGLWLREAHSPGRIPMAKVPPKPVRDSSEEYRKEKERRLKVEAKLHRALEERDAQVAQVERVRRDCEELRKRLSDIETASEDRVEEALALKRKEWFQRYGEIDAVLYEETDERLEALLKRADKAFNLQRKADEEYGSIAGVRRKLIRVDLYLDEIERIYADSMVVHTEVTKTREALLREKKRLLGLPGIEKALGDGRNAEAFPEIRRKIRMLEPVPENLPKINRLHALVDRLVSLGFVEDRTELDEDIRHKKRQVLEALYACFPPGKKWAGEDDRGPRTFEDFARSGRGGSYDLYVDGYNILLKILAGRQIPNLASVREEFIDAVCEKASAFRKVVLVFDGQRESKENRGGVEIIYSDKAAGTTADVILIDALNRRKDNRALIVTADLEIIRAVEKRVYAVVDPCSFYSFVFETPYPPTGED